MTRPTLRTIAELAGCSRQAVSLALRNDPQIPTATRRRIAKIARDAGYEPDAKLGALMAHVRSREPEKSRATLAMLHAVPRELAEATSCYGEWRSGAVAQARRAGYGIDDLWLGDEPLHAAALRRVLQARGILGLLLPCLANAASLPAPLHSVLARYPCATVGYPDPRLPLFPGATNDRYATGAALFARAVAAGCRRIGAVVSTGSELLSDPRFSSAILAAQDGQAGAVALPTLNCLADGRQDFDLWMKQHRPDCVITSVPAVWGWIERLGFPVPKKVGFLYWQLTNAGGNWSGTRQNDGEIGTAALTMLVAQITRGEHGVPPVQLRVMVKSSRVEGGTLRAPRKAAPKTVRKTPRVTAG